jgi:hypothetical protein
MHFDVRNHVVYKKRAGICRLHFIFSITHILLVLDLDHPKFAVQVSKNRWFSPHLFFRAWFWRKKTQKKPSPSPAGQSNYA